MPGGELNSPLFTQGPRVLLLSRLGSHCAYLGPGVFGWVNRTSWGDRRCLDFLESAMAVADADADAVLGQAEAGENRKADEAIGRGA